MLHVKTLKALSLLVLLGFIWGSGYSLAKYAMTHGVSPLGYSFWQCLGPAVLLTLLCSFTQKISFFRCNYWPYFLTCGLLGIAIPNTNMYFIAAHIPAGLLAVVVNIVPLIVYPLALLSGQEKPDRWRFLALILSMIGILLILGVNPSGFSAYWPFLALISPLAFAFCSLYINAKQPKEINALQGASGMLIAASVLLTPLVLQQQAFYSLSGPFDLVKQVIVLEIFLSSLGYFIFFMIIRLAGPVFYSLTGGVVALTGLCWGYWLFGEIPTMPQSLAIALVIFAIFLLSWRQTKHA